MFTFKSMRLVQHLQERAENISALSKVAARIHLPAELAWWYYQEFGTTGPYEIRPKNGTTIRLPETAEFAAARFPFVIHPGISPKHFVRDVLPEIRNLAVRDLIGALLGSDYNPETVRGVLLDKTMPEIKEMIAVSMSEAIQQHRQDSLSPGKLGEAEPADVYRQAATIEDSSQ